MNYDMLINSEQIKKAAQLLIENYFTPVCSPDERRAMRKVFSALSEVTGEGTYISQYFKAAEKSIPISRKVSAYCNPLVELQENFKEVSGE